MDYVDATLVQLADEATRAGLLDETALESAAGAAYDAEALGLEGPYSAVFDQVDLGYAVSQPANWDGQLWHTGGQRYQASLRGGGDAGGSVRIDALWRGAVVARVLPATAPVVDVTTAWPTTSGIDDAIVSELGALPSDAADLEAERRARYMARISAGLHQPTALTQSRFDRLLASVGATSVSALMDRIGVNHLGSIRIAFAAPDPTAQPTPKRLAIAAAILVRDAGFSVADLLWQSRRAVDELARAGIGESVNQKAARKRPVIALWLVPESVFDDADWPGANGVTDPESARALRRASATAWLASAGIALATTPV